jgi:hypothetical protein
MTQDEIIEIAVQAGIAKEIAEVNIDIMETFAKLVAQHILEEYRDDFRRVTHAEVNAAINKEREACAEECEQMMLYPNAKQKSAVHQNVWEAAKAIRARGQA